jgi:hypothetical protein
MGRPINKKFFGWLADADDTRYAPASNETFFNITVNVKVASNAASDEGYILRQRSSNKFLVNDTKTGTAVTPGGSGTGNVGICTLVDKAVGSLAANEMSIQGTIVGSDGRQVRIKKLFNRTCRDFNNARYKWTIENDSTETVMRLTAI